MVPQNGEPLAALYRALGHQVVAGAGVLWRDGGRLALVAEPSGAAPTGGVAEIRGLLRRHRRLAAIFCTDQPSGKSVPLFTATVGFTAGGARRQFRQQLRVARRLCTVRPLSWEDWRDMALPCDRAALRRQGRADAPLLHPAGRAGLAATAATAPELSLLGCFAGDRLAAYLVVRTRGAIRDGLVMHWDDELAAHHPTHLLYAEAVARLIGEPAIRELRIGRQSLPANPGLDRFKRNAGFEERPCHLAVLLHPWVAPLLETRPAAWLLARLRRLLTPVWPGAAALEVIELAAASRRGMAAAETLAAGRSRSG